MDSLFTVLFDVLFGGAARRWRVVLLGGVVVATGLLLAAGGPGGSRTAGALMAAAGFALIVLGIAFRRLDNSSKGPTPAPPPDSWRPPDSEEVGKILGGRKD